MSCTTLFSRTAVLSSLCLTLMMGNSAIATLLLSEQLTVAAYSGTGTKLPPFSENAFLDSDPDSWNAAVYLNPAIEFEFLQPYKVEHLRSVVDQNTNEPAWSELQLSIAPLQNDSADTKATYLTFHLFSTKEFSPEIIRLPNESVIFRQSHVRPHSSVTWGTKVQYSICTALVLVALGAVGRNFFHWRQRRQKIMEFERFSSIAESDLLMARLPLGAPPRGARAELGSPDPAHSRPHSRSSNIQ